VIGDDASQRVFEHWSCSEIAFASKGENGAATLGRDGYEETGNGLRVARLVRERH